MNGQEPQENQVKPEFGAAAGTPPTSFNPQFGFSNQNPANQTAWSPSVIPTPGPIPSQEPVINQPQTSMPQPMPAMPSVPVMTAPQVPFVPTAPTVMPQVNIPQAMAPIFPAAMSQPVVSASEVKPMPSFPAPAGVNAMPAPTASQAFAGAMPGVSTPQAPTFSAPVSQEAFIPSSPTAPQFDIRTMQSDATSVRATGGGEPAPQTFSPASFGGSETQMAATPEAQGVGVVAPMTPTVAPVVVPVKSSASKIIIVISVIFLLVALGVAGFLIFKTSIGINKNATVPTPSAPAIAPVVTQTNPPVGINQPVPAAVVPEVTIRSTHKSLFVVKPDLSEDVVVKSIAKGDIIEALYPKTLSTYPKNSIREVTLKTEKEGYVNFSDFLVAMLPDLVPNKDSYKKIFEDDFTLFSYKGNSAAPGFIVNVKPGVSQADLDSFGVQLEGSSIGNFYLEDQGAHNPFIAENINDKLSRLAVFPKNGLGFAYSWLKSGGGPNTLVVSSSYNGMKTVLGKIGL